MEGIELPSALALLLRANLLGARERPFERGLQLGLVGDLAADVADEAAEPRAQQAQLPMVTLELLGMSIARRFWPACLVCRYAAASSAPIARVRFRRIGRARQWRRPLGSASVRFGVNADRFAPQKSG